jgi:hypothetical protein
MVFFVASSGAVTGSPSSFESQDALNNATPPVPDGNMTNDVTGHSDWNCFANGGASNTTGFVTSGITVGSTCSSALVKGNAVAKSDPAATTSDDSWVNGTKMDQACEPVGTNKNPGKDDFTAVASYNETRSSDNHTFLYGATIRYTANGSASENVELNQVAGTSACPITRTPGDHLLAFDYNSGGKVLNLHVLTWIDSTHSTLGGNSGTCIIKTDSMPCWGASVITPAAASFDGDTNVSAIDAGKNGINGNALVAGQFAEFGVDLTSALDQNPNACNTTSQIDWESRSSGSSFSSNPEDIAIETQPISNCGRIIIHKQTSPRGINKAFPFDSNIPNPTGTVTTSSSPYCQGDTTPNGTPGFSLNDNGNSSSNNAANTEDCQNVLKGSYTITEETQSGFTLSGITCTKTTGGTSTVTYGSANHSVFTAGDTSANISLSPQETVECTYTNTQKTALFSTQQSTSADVTPGTAVTDTATVTGSASDTPSGTVTFYLCGPLTSAAGCSSSDSTRVSAGTGTLAATSTTGQASATSSPAVNTGNGLAPGIYCFEATWPGDSNYVGAKDSTTATNECFTVATINTTTVTRPSDSSGTSKSSVTLGGSIYDTAVVTGTAAGGDPTGTVHFYVCSGSSACTTSTTGVTDLGTSSLVSDGVAATYTSSATSASFQPSATGTYCFLGIYGGSTVYNTSNDSTTSRECFTVTDTTTSQSTQTWYPNDSASVSADNGAKLNGTLSIQLYTGLTCGVGGGSAVNNSAARASTTLTNATSGSVSTSNTTYSVGATGDYSWLVTFTSTDGNVGGSSHCEKTSLTITN